MIIYNVTVKIELEVHNDWLQWMQDVHIPDVMATGLFEKYRLCRVMEEDQRDGITYAIQYFCESMSVYFQYQREFAPALQKEHTARYRDRYVAFRTLMKVVD